MKILIGFLIFFGAGFVVSLIEYFRKKPDSFSVWFKWYFTNLLKGWLTAVSTFFGRSTTRPERITTDRAYASIEASELQAAIEHTHGIMDSQGWNNESYETDALDCDDFAMKMKVEATKFLVDNGNFTKGIPIHLFGYTRENGRRHMLIYGSVDGERIYYEVYPGTHNLLPKKLTLKEESSGTLDFV